MNLEFIKPQNISKSKNSYLGLGFEFEFGLQGIMDLDFVTP